MNESTKKKIGSISLNERRKRLETPSEKEYKEMCDREELKRNLIKTSR